MEQLVPVVRRENFPLHILQQGNESLREKGGRWEGGGGEEGSLSSLSVTAAALCPPGWGEAYLVLVNVFLQSCCHGSHSPPSP